MKQINLNNFTFQKLLNYTFVAVIIILSFLVYINSNKFKTKIITVKIPAVSGTFQSAGTILHTPIYIPEYYKDENEENRLRKELGITKELMALYKEELDTAIDEFTHANDSLKKQLYAQAIALNSFSLPMEDEYIKIENVGLVVGTVKNMKTTYTIKERTAEVKVPQLRWRLLLGGELGINKDFNQGAYKVNIGIQNAKFNTYRLSYLKINNQEFGMIGYDFNLWSKTK